MAATKQTARKSTGGSAKARKQKDRILQRKTAPRSQMSLDIEEANRLMVEADDADHRPRERTNDDPKVSRSGKTRTYTVSFNGTLVKKIVPVVAPIEKQRLDNFTKKDLKKPVDERLRTVRVVKLIDDVQGALVEWMDGVEMWVKPKSLVEYGGTSASWLECTRAFMASEEPNLLKFFESSPWGRQYDGASDDGLCGFHAVRAAVSFLGLEVTREAVQAYVTEVQRGRGIDLTDGTNFAEIKRFVKTQELAVDVAGMEKNWYKGRGSGAAVVFESMEVDGVYLVAGSIGKTVWRHVVAVWKCGETVLVMDGENCGDLESLDWIADISYVRKVQLA